jgi:prepilin-type processing-associated H-X9-DG protein
MMRTQPTTMFDWPATRHNFAGMFAFGDCHAEIHKWTDGRTRETSTVGSQDQGNPDNPDIIWMQQRASSLYR